MTRERDGAAGQNPAGNPSDAERLVRLMARPKYVEDMHPAGPAPRVAECTAVEEVEDTQCILELGHTGPHLAGNGQWFSPDALFEKVERAIRLAAQLGDDAFDFIEGRGLAATRRDIRDELRGRNQGEVPPPAPSGPSADFVKLLDREELEALDASLTALGTWDVSPEVGVSPLAWPMVRRLILSARAGMEDRERLDWLSNEAPMVYPALSDDKRDFGVRLKYPSDKKPFGGVFATTLRAAIDIARTQSSGLPHGDQK